jgi:carboxyl-terminal processing protease
MRGQRIALSGLVAVVSFVSGGWLLQRGTEQAGGVYQKARLFDDVLGYVSEYYVDSLGESRLYDMAIDGLLNELNDPYTGFLREDDLRELRESTTGNYGGLGIRIDVRDGWITVIAPIAGTPAEAAGLETGDRIVEVDGVSTFGWKNQKAVDVLRGPPGSKVRLGVARPGYDEVLQYTIERAEIHVKAIQLATVLQGNIGYISLVNSSISETLADELVEEITALRSAGARSLVLDLRYNPGGLLDQGVAVADLFLDPGQGIVSTRGRARGTSESFADRQRQRWPDMPIVVIVNQGTASASEIIAGALQDNDRALVLGTPTFGKGLVQSVYRLGRYEALRLTTARWYTPSGRTIQREFRTADARGEEAPDSVPTDQPDSTQMFRTTGGRVVYGGGGIRPDLIVPPDTLTSAEQEFLRTLGGQLPLYRDILTSYALELKGANVVKSSPAQVTDAMRAELLRRLRARGLEISDRIYAGARAWIDAQLAYEVERYVFGRESESRLRITDDNQVQKAIELLRRAGNTRELLALVAEDGGPRRTP